MLSGLGVSILQSGVLRFRIAVNVQTGRHFALGLSGAPDRVNEGSQIR